MSESNGLFRIERKGVFKFAFGDAAVLDPSGPALVFCCDPIQLYNEYAAWEDPFWANGKFIEAKATEYAEGKLALVQKWLMEGGRALEQTQPGASSEATALASTITKTEAFELIEGVRREFQRLKPFFSPPASESVSSSPENSELTFTH
jgi:hypothetical protein